MTTKSDTRISLIEPCPFCGSSAVSVSGPELPTTFPCVCCQECKAEGPTSPGMDATPAIEAWNKLSKKLVKLTDDNCRMWQVLGVPDYNPDGAIDLIAGAARRSVERQRHFDTTLKQLSAEVRYLRENYVKKGD